MKRPLAAVAVVYAAGLLAGELWPLPPSVLLPASFLFALLALFGLVTSFRISGVFRGFLWPLLFLAGSTNLACRTAPLSPYDLRNLHLAPAEIVTVYGTLSDTPTQRIHVQDDRESYRSLAHLRLTRLRRDKADWQPARGTLLVLTPGILPQHFFAGQDVEISGVIAEPASPAAEGLFDYRAYLRRQSIYYQIKTDGTNDWTLISPGKQLPFSDRFLAWAQATLARGLPAQDEPLQMLWAMTLGWKTIDNQIYEPFMQSGTMHIFAISGLHIALIAGIFVALLRVLQLPRLWCGFVVVPLIWFYTAATGWQPSAIRSTVMMTLIIGGWALSRPTDLINSLAASAFCILLWDPQQLFGASFQLSFFVVLSIALLLPPFENAWDRMFQTDPLLPRDLVPRWKRTLLQPLRWVASSFAISLASWIGSLPLTAHYFHLFNPVTLLANLVIVPLSSCALAANLASLLCGPWLPGASELFNHSAWFWMASMIQLSKWSTLLPCAYSYVHAPSLLAIALFYGLIIGLLIGCFRTRGGRALATATGLATVLLYLWQSHGPRSSATLTILPLSGGFSVHARHPQFGEDLLVDCGASNGVRFITTPFLRSRGIDRLPALLLSHGDIRHIGGAPLLAKQFSIDRIEASRVRFRSSAYRQTMQLFNQTPNLVQTLARDSRLGPWTIMHPEATDRFPRADDNAVVLAATLYGSRILLLSDLGPSGQAALLERYPDLRADILITGLPATSDPVARALIECLQPRLIVVADSEFPASERATASLRQWLDEIGIPVVYTRFSGTTTIDLQHHAWRLRTMSGLRMSSNSRAPKGRPDDSLRAAPREPKRDEPL